MKIREIENLLTESTSLVTTARAISAIADSLTQMYSQISRMASDWYDNNGSLKGFQLVKAGVTKRWHDAFYFNRLQKELYDLTKQLPRKQTEELASFLNKMPIFSEIEDRLPEILLTIGRNAKISELVSFAQTWINSRERYAESIKKYKNNDDEDSAPSTVSKPKEKPASFGSQYSAVENIVNDILKELPKSVAGDIRNAIARSPNKLLALQQEITKRGIKMPGPLEESWKSKMAGLGVAAALAGGVGIGAHKDQIQDFVKKKLMQLR